MTFSLLLQVVVGSLFFSSSATLLVVGFAIPSPLLSRGRTTTTISTGKSTTTVLHVASYPPSYQQQQEQQQRSPFDEDQYVYIPKSELDEAISEEKRKHEQEKSQWEQTMEEQRQKLMQLKEKARKERLKYKMYHDASSTDNLTMLWSENQNDKMRRVEGRLEYLQDENELLRLELEEEHEQHTEELAQLKEQLRRTQEKADEAKQVLGLERAYHDTSVRLLEAGLERETKKVESLREKLAALDRRIERRRGHRTDDPLPIKTHQHPSQQHQPLQPQVQPQTQNQWNKRNTNGGTRPHFQQVHPHSQPFQPQHHYHYNHYQQQQPQQQQQEEHHHHHSNGYHDDYYQQQQYERHYQQYHYDEPAASHRSANSRRRPNRKRTRIASMNAHLGIDDFRNPMFR
mmetsp:Transcript_17185/g.29939  ORF Transcript_17185/g.29939 Transcript_17185/m.29939 type:complete len:401 (+) Transcript_17185:172-1374(+)